MGGVDAGGVEYGDRVVGHLLEAVVTEGLVAAAGTAVVERDDAVARREHEPLHVPAVLVGPEALDHQHRRCTGTAQHLVVQPDAVG